ncbi:MAG: flagellin lysine-N-methylase, partial [Rickettsiales bacterium]|nr:flagellin lysine-N-methylase [Rickettsiales bacterium]
MSDTETHYTAKSTRVLKEFQCLGADCIDTCCKGWGMQFDQKRKSLYETKAPELLDAVNTDEMIMKRDPETDYCIKYDNGLCSIHKKYGETFLGDACFFYPRVTRQIGDNNVVMTSTLSCPEIARISLYNETNPFEEYETDVDRIPESTKNYLDEGAAITSIDDINSIRYNFIEYAGSPDHASNVIMPSIVSVARSLEYQDPEKWNEASKFLLKTAESRLLPPEPHVADPYKLFHSFCGLIGAAKKHNAPRLKDVVEMIENALDTSINWETLTIENNAKDFSAFERMKELWHAEAAEQLEPVLKRYIQSQLSLSSFPFAGFGNSLPEKATIIAIRFATIKLALMASLTPDAPMPDQNTVIRIIQTISRFLDHLGDPT